MSAPRQWFDKDLDELNQEILKMGGIIEQQIYDAVESLISKDLGLAETVINRDDQVDELQQIIEDKCIRLVIRQQPMAKDMRAVFAGIKLVTDLERISDTAVNISRIAKRIIDEQYIKPLIDIPRMAKVAQDIVRVALDSFVRRDINMAKSLFNMEEEIDHLYAQIFRELLVIMMENPKTISQATQLLMVARHLERIGDHSTNIGEMVVYLETGKRIKLND
ncbi:Phosphate-specific transport system accessory protein PhoU homolog [Tepidanaerobacter acetatoxydans Re1]|uniref:Phosphate-specific transport system accessory protein PhoU n=1 Tax=Tepidanaerobacter acetatoxydans (strain DSM 21804 / JCM 16047 / Re1) TaxID=1209989 RepID=F4LRR6_TEPAE|nr:phosphate signaling complex protein PhoU [Tepidanaerobacter acetatoxydans]AEE91134.1 phosphate uptake regulator, PhoU [Tepidanaerobacter acetatoxydans Re1]CCP25799.1 Phosphate-specific transport system accessory protein PhoU homolog [Tepidanaerobacter acetatoxydans Re1]